MDSRRAGGGGGRSHHQPHYNEPHHRGQRPYGQRPSGPQHHGATRNPQRRDDRLVNHIFTQAQTLGGEIGEIFSLKMIQNKNEAQ